MKPIYQIAQDPFQLWHQGSASLSNVVSEADLKYGSLTAEPKKCQAKFEMRGI